MRIFGEIRFWAPYAVHFFFLLRLAPVSGQARAIQPAEACVEFESGSFPGSAWTFDDCMDVWTHFSASIGPGLQRRLPLVDLWKPIASELRRVGTPCLVAPSATTDGVGSSTIRHLASWIFSKEMGCDWAKPDWGKKSVDGGNGTVMYCHRTATTQEMDLSKPLAELQAMRRCSVVNWLEYFQLGVPSVDQPEDGNFNIIQPALHTTEALDSVKRVLQDEGFANQPWDRVVLTYHPSFASQHLVCVGCWDHARRQIARNVIEEARQNFHQHPRPWYDESPQCAYDSTKLNFAIHVRMGDRREFQDGNVEYFQLLEKFMDTVSDVVISKGRNPPAFHIFSETLLPCPSLETGRFDEFPTWQFALDDIPACLAAETPATCPEKEAGYFCSPNRSGVFNVVGKPIVLHVGPDVQNAMSCMIHSDGVVMGCSTFGQIAGLLTKGISFFSMQCGGAATPDQYKSIPPMAVAEGGYLWVPIAGSWRDPVLASVELFRGALDTYIAIKDALP